MNLDASPTPIYPDDMPEGWQRIGAFYRRSGGFVLRAYRESTPGRNTTCDGAVELFVVGYGDWLLLHQHFREEYGFDQGVFHGGAVSMLVGMAWKRAGNFAFEKPERLPNDFTFWMNAVNRAIPMRARQEKE